MAMMTRAVTSAFVLAFAACTPAPTQKDQPFAVTKPTGGKLAPREAGEGVWSHSPYEVGACETCHANADAASPGPVKVTGRALCEECHDEFMAHIASRQMQHEAIEDCTNCHNPHNATNAKLTHSQGNDLCLGCHEKLANQTHPEDGSAAGSACVSCHDPHAADGKGLLKENS